MLLQLDLDALQEGMLLNEDQNDMS